MGYIEDLIQDAENTLKKLEQKQGVGIKKQNLEALRSAIKTKDPGKTYNAFVKEFFNSPQGSPFRIQAEPFLIRQQKALLTAGYTIVKQQTSPQPSLASPSTRKQQTTKSVDKRSPTKPMDIIAAFIDDAKKTVRRIKAKQWILLTDPDRRRAVAALEKAINASPPDTFKIHKAFYAEFEKAKPGLLGGSNLRSETKSFLERADKYIADMAQIEQQAAAQQRSKKQKTVALQSDLFANSVNTHSHPRSIVLELNKPDCSQIFKDQLKNKLLDATKKPLNNGSVLDAQNLLYELILSNSNPLNKLELTKNQKQEIFDFMQKKPEWGMSGTCLSVVERIAMATANPEEGERHKSAITNFLNLFIGTKDIGKVSEQIKAAKQLIAIETPEEQVTERTGMRR